MPFILTRVFQISYACLGRGGQGCPILRASSEHVFNARSASKKGTWPLLPHPSYAARCANTGIVPATPLPFSVFCRPALFMTIRRKITQSPNITGIDLSKIPFLQDAQKDCPARPQRVKARRLDIWDLPVDRRGPRIGQVSVDAREAPASEKLSG